MKNKLKHLFSRLFVYIKYSLVTISLGAIFRQGSLSCGGTQSGFPFKFVSAHCECSAHTFLDSSHFLYNLIYHAFIWSIALYLWADAKESWQIMKNYLKLRFKKSSRLAS